MKHIIFLGPSLPLDEARALLDADYRPPAAQADILSAVANDRPDVIGLVDGVFHQELSVWHKEILFALERGVRVFGASSMGALRAAEMDAFGMVGVGEVYAMYASGVFTDDDDVALAHGSAEEGYRKLSEPMVNVRATLRCARKESVISEGVEAELLRRAKALHFVERTFPRLLADAWGAGLPSGELSALEGFVRQRYVDVKREDAIRLLQTLGGLGPEDPRPAPTVRFNDSHLFRVLYERERRVRHEELELPLSILAEHAALHIPGFHDMNFHSLNRELVLMLARQSAVEVCESDVALEARRFRFRQHLEDDAALEAWLARNHLSQEEWWELMKENALCRAMQRALLTERHLERTTKPVLDALRLEGLYEANVTAAAMQEHMLRAHHPLLEREGEDAALRALPMEQLVEEHLRETGCQMDLDYRHWWEEAGFPNEEALRYALVRSRLARGVMARMQAQFRRLLGTDEPDP